MVLKERLLIGLKNSLHLKSQTIKEISEPRNFKPDTLDRISDLTVAIIVK